MDNECEILVKEYESLRTEVIERIKTAFAHLAYFGAVIAFGFKSPEGNGVSQETLQWLAFFGATILLYISIINWFWVGRIADHLQVVENKINTICRKPILTWEQKVKKMSRWVLLPPRCYPRDDASLETKPTALRE